VTAPGVLIAIEGGDGAGKSTQAARLASAVGASLTREPGGTPVGERIRELLLDPAAGDLSDRTELLLMLAARAQHLAERILPILELGQHVVVDRFSGSTIAYQGYGRGLPLDEVRSACAIATAGRIANLSILIDVPWSIARARRGGSPSQAQAAGAVSLGDELQAAGEFQAVDRIELTGGGFHERVREGFLAEAAADPLHWCVIDGTLDVEDVAAEIHREVAIRLGLLPVQP
jgi:dTMP kinase